MTRVKICGITSESDRDLCISSGVDFLGFNIYNGSKRYVKRDLLKKLIKPAIREISVLVTVNNTIEELYDIISEVNPGYLQLHGDEDINIIENIRKMNSEIKIIKRVTINEQEKYNDILKKVDFLICDSDTKLYGGSGEKFNWMELNSLKYNIFNRMFIAGGINLQNIDEILKYDVYAIDIASGVEESPGKKDAEKIKEIIMKVRGNEKE